MQASIIFYTCRLARSWICRNPSMSLLLVTSLIQDALPPHLNSLLPPLLCGPFGLATNPPCHLVASYVQCGAILPRHMPMTPLQPRSQMALPHGHVLTTNSSQTWLGGSSASTSTSEVPVYPAQNMTDSTSAPSVVALHTMPFLGPASNVHPLSDDSLSSQLPQLIYSDFSACIKFRPAFDDSWHSSPHIFDKIIHPYDCDAFK